MKTVTSREFSRYFRSHRLSDTDVTVNGRVVGHWTARVNDGGKPKEEFKPMFKDKKVNKETEGLSDKTKAFDKLREKMDVREGNFKPMFKDKKVNKQFN